MKAGVKDAIGTILGTKIKNVTPVSGGDISKAYLLHTTSNTIFCKLNSAPTAKAMFVAEAEGLEAIAATKTIKTPHIYTVEDLEAGACLLMEYVPPKRPGTKELEVFGAQLAAMHQISADYFGWGKSNFIGNLPQSNQKHDNWISFYIEERLSPQIQAAINQKLLTKDDVPGIDRLQNVMNSYCPDIKPSLLHGDLWNGNFIVNESGVPYLIDPAVYFGDSEIDLSMSKLFGGFGAPFYNAYYEINPSRQGEANRMAIYQLYYLLVHLNLFGKTYYGSVKEILHAHF